MGSGGSGSNGDGVSFNLGGEAMSAGMAASPQHGHRQGKIVARHVAASFEGEFVNDTCQE